MKRAFKAAGLPIVDYLPVTRRQYEQDPNAFIALGEERLGYPCFSKFANSRSSVGSTKAHNRGELVAGLRLALSCERKLPADAAVEASELEVVPCCNDA